MKRHRNNTTTFVKIECHLHGQKYRSFFLNPDHSVVLADIDDFTVTISLIVLPIIFFSDSAWYYLTPYQNLIRLNLIFMIRKIGKKNVHEGPPPLPPPSPPEPSLCPILEPRWFVGSEKFFDRKMSQG